MQPILKLPGLEVVWFQLKEEKMRWLLNIVFFILLLITAAFTARYIKSEALPDNKQVSWHPTHAAVKMR